MSGPRADARLSSIQIGRVQELCADAATDARWTTAFFKTPVASEVEVGPLGVAGDAQADAVHHGGVDKAILFYSADHAADWCAVLRLDVLPPGGFGENFTVEGLDESTVCLGDRWRFGPVELEVSQPRQPCWKLSRRWGSPDLVRRVIDTGRTGWYCRVIHGGRLCAPIAGDLVARPYPDWPISRANAVFYARLADPAQALQLAAVPVLSAAWKSQLVGER